MSWVNVSLSKRGYEQVEPELAKDLSTSSKQPWDVQYLKS